MLSVRNLTEQQKQEIIHLYTVENRGQLYCAQKVLGVKDTTLVKKALREANIHIRNFGEAAVLSNKNRTKYTSKDKDFFKKQTPDMAWILGFIASDGTIRKKENEIKIGLSIKDREILEKIKKTINLDEPIKEYQTKLGYDCCSLRWTSEDHKKDLAKYSIVPAKTFILKPPYALDKKYWIDYIRGYFDGDGSVNIINNKGSKTIRWQVWSATKELLDFILNYFYEEYSIPKVNVQVSYRSKHPLYFIQYSTKSSRKIYKVLYNTDSNLYLQRKKDAFDEAIKAVKPLKKI